jgi:flagellar M-ring protein FliF
MDFLNQASAQLTNLFRSMSAGARMVAGLLLAVIVVSLAFLFNHQFAGPDSFLMGGEAMTSDEINTAVGVLGQAGLTNFVVEGNRIRVPRGEEATYTAALLKEGALPGNYGSYLQKALSESGGFTSKARQGQMYKVALQLELARVVRNMKGINNAIVLYDIQEGRGLHRKNEYTASVSVATNGGVELEETTVTAIRNLVASAIAGGMSPDSVVVSDLTTGSTYPAKTPGQALAGQQDPYIQNKMQYEKLWSEKIRRALRDMQMPGVIVACNVDLNKEIEHEQQKTQHDPKTVPVSVQEESKTLSSMAPQLGGPPGFGSQGGVPPNQPAVARAGSGGAQSDEEISRSTVRNVTSQDVELIRTAPLTPDRVTAAIAIPSSYIEQVWRQRNKPAPGEQPKTPTRAELKAVEVEKVNETQVFVATLLSLSNQPAPDPMKQVHVSVFDSLPVEQPPEPGAGDHALAWLGDHWSTLGTGLLGLVSLVMLRSMVRAVPAAEPLPAAMPLAATGDDTIEPSTPGEKTASLKPTAAARLKRREKGGPSLREELVEVVREDPDAAANVLRSWINSST